MKNDYLKELYKQYLKSKGKEEDFYDYSNNEFIKWLDNLKQNTKIYKYHLIESGIMIDTIFTCELNKTPVDTIASLNTMVKSPFIYTKIFNEYDILTYITHNAYDKKDIDTLYKKCQSKVGVCYGVYGDNRDKDKDEKINDIYSLYEKISQINDVNMLFSKKDDLYIASVYTKKRLKYK